MKSVNRLFLLLALSTPLAAGAESPFDGVFAQAGLGLDTTESSIVFPDWLDVSISEESLIGDLAVGYSKSFGSMNLAVTAHYTVGDQAAGEFSDNGFYGDMTQVSIALQDTWSIAVEPGYRVGESMLLYARLGYASTSIDYHEVANGEHFHWTESTDGWIAGLGARGRFGSNWFGYAELNRIEYGEKRVTFREVFEPAPIEPRSLSAVIGAGFVF